MSELNSSNEQVIAEFRANDGYVAGFYSRESLLLLTTTGRKSGRPYTTPLSYQRDGEDLIVIGANIGSPKVPDWFHNLVITPRVTVELGAQRCEAIATVLEGERRARLLDRMRAAWNASRKLSPELPEMPAPADGEIPVVALSLRR